jgi:carbonic anhydrase
MARRGVVAIVVPLSLATALLALSGPAAQSQLPHQSPINISHEAIRVELNPPPLQISYQHSDVELEYIRKDDTNPAGCTTRHPEETEEGLVTAGTAFVTLAGVRYDLIQFHFHTPSEHRFEGQSTPLEMHLVHRSAAGRLLVIGVPLRAGAPSVVDKVLAKLAPECGENVHVGEIDLNSLLPRDRKSVRYDGSLTTAPFTEDVQWFLMCEETVSKATIDRFQGLFTSGNARATQPLNGRTVQADRPHI